MLGQQQNRMKLTKYGKSFELKKRGISTSNYQNVEFPLINKTIDVIQKTADYNFQRKLNFLDKFSWTLVEKNYDQMSDKQIYREYTSLRQQIYKINQLVVKQINKIQRKSEKKRLITQIEPEKLNQIRQKQIQNNLCVLIRMQKQYKGLVHKSENLQAKQILENQIQTIITEIKTVRLKINSLKLKNKTIGQNIINTDQIFIQIRDSQREFEVWKKKKSQLQIKLYKVKQQNQKIKQNLEKIDPSSDKAQSFKRNQNQNKRQLEETNRNQQKYSQKMHNVQVLKKNFQIFAGLKQQKYHQLLKQLQGHLQKDKQIQQRTKQTEGKMNQYSGHIKILQKSLRAVKTQSSRLSIYLNQNESQQNSSQIFHKKNKNAPKFNTLNKLRALSISSREEQKKSIKKIKVETTTSSLASQSTQINQKTMKSSTQQDTYKGSTHRKVQKSKFKAEGLSNNTKIVLSSQKDSTLIKFTQNQKTQLNESNFSKNKDSSKMMVKQINLRSKQYVHKNLNLQQISKQNTQSKSLQIRQNPIKESSKQLAVSKKVSNEKKQFEKTLQKYKNTKNQNQIQYKEKQYLQNVSNEFEEQYQDEKQGKNSQMNSFQFKINEPQSEINEPQSKINEINEVIVESLDNQYKNEPQKVQKQQFSMKKLTIDLQKIQTNINKVTKLKSSSKAALKLKTLTQNQQIEVNDIQNSFKL